MRTSEERIEELHRRMSMRRQEKARRRDAAISASAICAGLAVAVLLAVVIARVPVQAPNAAAAAATASIFADRMALGYVVVALLAFCLGALVTVFCFRMKKHREEKPSDDRKL